jgi:hypothetical protein
MPEFEYEYRFAEYECEYERECECDGGRQWAPGGHAAPFCACAWPGES